jgi:hypothetical protein
LLPWIAVLLLLLRPANRTGQAWWIWLPLGLVHLLAWTAVWLLGGTGTLPGGVGGLLTDLYLGLAFGVAALWLSSPYLGRASRLLSGVGMFGFLTAFGALAFLLPAAWHEDTDGPLFVFALFLGFCGLQVTLALSLASILCRRRFAPVRFSVCLLALLFAGWLAFALPVALIGGAMAGRMDWGSFLGAIGMFAGLTFVVLLPFLLLSFIHPYYRERLRSWLRLPDKPVSRSESASPQAA